MPYKTYRHSDLQHLTGSVQMLGDISRLPCIEIRNAGDAFALLASAEDVPSSLRRYYSKVGKVLTRTECRLKKHLRTAESDGEKLSARIHSALDHVELPEEYIARLHHVNARLQALEKSLQQMIDGMHDRMEGLNPLGVEWDDWDRSEINLCLNFKPDAERPAYNNNLDECGLLEPLEIRVSISTQVRSNVEKEPWGLDDGQNHNDLAGCEGSPMQHFHQCYLFHELWDHADVGYWGMLNLHSIWVEFIPHRSGNFTI